MSVIEKLFGVVPPLMTPLTEDRKIDEAALRRIVNHVIEGGVHSVFVMGSTGEFAAFSREERRLSVEIVADEVAGRVPVLAGVSDSGTELAARNARDAEAAGADAVVASIPYYFPMFTDESVLEHFRHIAGSTSLPMVAYNIPQYVKEIIKVDIVAKLAEEGTAAAIKDSSGDMTYFQELLYRMKDMPGFKVLQGSEPVTGASLLMGAHGFVPGAANVFPKLCVQLYEAASNGRADETVALQGRLNELRRLYPIGGSFIGSLKVALSAIGLCSPTATMPVPPVSSESACKIREIVQNFGNG